MGHFPACREAKALRVGLQLCIRCLALTVPLNDAALLEPAAAWRRRMREALHSVSIILDMHARPRDYYASVFDPRALLLTMAAFTSLRVPCGPDPYVSDKSLSPATPLVAGHTRCAVCPAFVLSLIFSMGGWTWIMPLPEGLGATLALMLSSVGASRQCA